MNTLLKILLVEDNPGDVDLIREMLTATETDSFSVESVSRLSEALLRLKSGGIDLILLDLGLPDSSGLDTFLKLKEAGPEIPAIILTGNQDQDIAVTSVRAGAQDYLVKGQITGNILVRHVLYAFERRQAEERIKSQLEELQRWQDVMLGREDRVQELKREVNELCRRLGDTARYSSQAEGSADSEAVEPKS